MAPKHHRLDIYDVYLHLATNRRDWGTLRRAMKPLGTGSPESLGMTQRLAFRPDDGSAPEEHYVFWIDTKTLGDDTANLVDTCAHEAAHAANFILDRAGHNIASPDEPHAYLVGWLTRWIWEGCRG